MKLTLAIGALLLLFCPAAVLAQDSAPPDLASDPEEAMRLTLRDQIEAIEAGQPNYDALTPNTAATFRSAAQTIQENLHQWGRLEIVDHHPALRSGWYVYNVLFDSALVQWAIRPPDADGKIPGLGFKTMSQWSASNRKGPNVGTEAWLRRHVESLGKGSPNYDEMSPGLAQTVREQLPHVRDSIRRLGALKSITFLTVEPNGMNEYDVEFENGQAIWWIGPLTANGMASSLIFRNISTGVTCCQIGTGP
jgi:hypothetical protein